MMAAAKRKPSSTKGQAFVEKEDDQDVFENLMAKLPTRETWDAEFCLEVLVLG
jgi:hypothetical protein